MIGFIAGNSNKREKLVLYLKLYSPIVFIPFFSGVGLRLNFPVFIHAIGFSLLASVIRVGCMFFGCIFGGYMSGLDPTVYVNLWMGLIPQAGVSLGLAAVVGSLFHDTFGPDFESTVIGW